VKEFYGNEPRQLIRIINNTDIEARTFAPDDDARLWRWVEQQNKTADIYFAPNPLKYPMSKKAAKDDVREAVYLWIDLDPVKDAELEAERAAMLKLLRSERPDGIPAASWIIDSGRGFWGFWRLSPAQPVDGPLGTLTHQIEARGRGIEAAFGERFADGCRNIDRIARLPGTINHKTKQRAAVVGGNPALSYELSDFPEWEGPKHEPGDRPHAENLKIASAVEFIPNEDLSWEEWNNLGMAIWRATQGTGFEIFDSFSKRSGKYDAAATAVRWDHYETSPPTRIGAGTIFELAKRHGWSLLNAELRPLLYQTGEKGRSELFLAFINKALRLGADEDAIIEACLDEKYQGCSIFEHVRDNDGEDYIRQQILRAMNEMPPKGEKAIIQIKDGDLDKAWRKTEQILKNKNLPIYRRGQYLYQPLWRFEDNESGRKVLVAECSKFNMVQLRDMVGHHAVTFQTFDGRKKGWRNIDPPYEIIKVLLDIGHADFPQVAGIITSPTMRPDGSLLTEPGYDRAAKLWYKPSPDVGVLEVPERPTMDQAREALARLNELICEFPFDGEDEDNQHSSSRSAVLAGMMTAVLRGAFQAAPIFVITAPEARTGKSFIVVLISIIATGHKPVPIAGATSREEMEKRIETAALAGRSIMHLNNLPNEMEVESEALSHMSAEGEVTIRKLGRHEEGKCDCRGTTVFANGNNIKVLADLVPKTALCRLNANMENPESRTFVGKPVEKVRSNRGAYLVDIFTIARAFEAAGSPKQEAKTVTGYEDWSRRVQQPLLWLGEADPMGGMEMMRAMDTRREERRQLLEVLRKYKDELPEYFTVADCTRLAEEMVLNTTSGRATFKRPDLRDLMLVRGEINGRSFGRLLAKRVDQMADGWCIKFVAGGKAAVYRLAGPPGHGEEGPPEHPAQSEEDVF
jgi:putative DNA primase/helicase